MLSGFEEMPARLVAAAGFIRAGKLHEARAALTRLLRNNPSDIDAAVMICAALELLAEPEQMLYYAQRASGRAPDDPRLLVNLGNARRACDDLAGAAAAYRRSLELDPGGLQSRVGLSNVLIAEQINDEAQAVCTQGLELHPNSVPLRTNLGIALTHAGRAREGVRILRGAVADSPEDPIIMSGLLYAMNYAGDLDPRDVFAAHRSYGELIQRTSGPPPPRATTPPDRDRPLRLGIISGDLRSHAVAFFIEPILARLDRHEWSVFCYATSRIHDDVSRRLESMSAGWRQVHRTPIPDLNTMIRRDRIDILIDLSGHTSGHRLPILHMGPAPVQITYFGYPNTTGVRGCDYRLVDGITDPVLPEADALATEQLVRLDPCFLCYRPPRETPPAAPPPRERLGYMTFGSFNALAKLDDISVRLYALVLHASPGARLLLKCHGLKAQGVRDDVARRFADAGIDRDRLILQPPGSGPGEMLRAYANMDVMLDSFPYNGTTTTCEALGMGVPVVTLRGSVCAARVSASILTAAGFPEWIAETEDNYVRIARSAGDTPRENIRTTFLASPVCHEEGFDARFAAALRSLWRAYCGSPARK